MKTNNYVPEAKPHEELENVAYLTGMTIQELIDADINTKRRILAVLSFLDFYP
jgi:hypothetical protein